MYVCLKWIRIFLISTAVLLVARCRFRSRMPAANPKEKGAVGSILQRYCMCVCVCEKISICATILMIPPHLYSSNFPPSSRLFHRIHLVDVFGRAQWQFHLDKAFGVLANLGHPEFLCRIRTFCTSFPGGPASLSLQMWKSCVHGIVSHERLAIVPRLGSLRSCFRQLDRWGRICWTGMRRQHHHCGGVRCFPVCCKYDFYVRKKNSYR